MGGYPCCCERYIEVLVRTGLNSTKGRWRLYGGDTRQRQIFTYSNLPANSFPQDARVDDAFSGGGAIFLSYSGGASSTLNSLDIDTGVIGSTLKTANPSIYNIGGGQQGYVPINADHSGSGLGASIYGVDSSGSTQPSNITRGLEKTNESRFAFLPGSPPRVYIAGGTDTWEVEVWDYDDVAPDYWDLTSTLSLGASGAVEDLICRSDHLYCSLRSYGDSKNVKVFKIDHATLTSTELDEIVFETSSIEPNYGNNPTSVLSSGRTPSGYGTCIYFGNVNPIRIKESDGSVERVFPDGMESPAALYTSGGADVGVIVLDRSA